MSTVCLDPSIEINTMNSMKFPANLVSRSSHQNVPKTAQGPETTKGNQHKVDSPSIFRGGEGGIRTLEAFRLTHFPGVLLRPLGHLSTLLLCRRALPFSTERRVFYGLSREIASLFLIRHWAARRSVRGLLNRVHHRSRADGSIQYCPCLAR